MRGENIKIEKHTPVDGDYYLVIVDGEMVAKTWTEEDANIISKAFPLMELAKTLVEFIKVSKATRSWNLVADEEIKLEKILKKVGMFLEG